MIYIGHGDSIGRVNDSADILSSIIVWVENAKVIATFIHMPSATRILVALVGCVRPAVVPTFAHRALVRVALVAAIWFVAQA